jgi:hypothetical protein
VDNRTVDTLRTALTLISRRILVPSSLGRSPTTSNDDLTYFSSKRICSEISVGSIASRMIEILRRVSEDDLEEGGTSTSVNALCV